MSQAVERELICCWRFVAAALCYGHSDFQGLPGHAAELLEAVTALRAERVKRYARCVAAAKKATSMLAAAETASATVLRDQTLGEQRAADEAQCQFLGARSRRLAAKLSLVSTQLRMHVYTDKTVPALRAAGEHVETAVREHERVRRKQAERLAGCEAAGAELEELAGAHHALQQDITDAEYELDEVEKYQRLAAMLG